MHIKRKFMLIFLLLSTGFFLSCGTHKEYLIAQNSIGPHKLGKRLKTFIDKEQFLDVTLNRKGKIESVLVLSDLYKTKEGFGVGSSMDSIIVTDNKFRVTESNLLEGGTVIGSLGNIVMSNGIVFIDSEKNGIVDMVWIDKKFRKKN